MLSYDRNAWFPSWKSLGWALFSIGCAYALTAVLFGAAGLRMICAIHVAPLFMLFERSFDHAMDLWVGLAFAVSFGATVFVAAMFARGCLGGLRSRVAKMALTVAVYAVELLLLFALLQVL